MEPQKTGPCGQEDVIPHKAGQSFSIWAVQENRIVLFLTLNAGICNGMY